MRSLRWLMLVVTFVGCVYQTNRTQGIGDGEIHGTARRKDGTPASGALVSLAGSDRVVAAGADGSFAVKKLVPGTWIVHVVEPDEHGTALRAAWLSVTTKFVPIPKNLTDGCSGAPPSAVTTELLGDVKLDDTVHVRGTVTGFSGSARVVVWRDIAQHAAPIEASAAVEANGNFDVAGVAPTSGTDKVHIAALAFDPIADPNAQQITSFGVADAPAGATDVTIDASTSARTQGGDLRTESVQLDAQWNTVPPGPQSVQLALASFTAAGDPSKALGPNNGSEPVDFSLDGNNRGFVVDAPAGVVDISIQASTNNVSDGILRGAIALPNVAILGPLELPEFADPCDDGQGGRDCDHDGLPGLALPADPLDPTDPVYQQYKACAADCADKLGPALVGATCTVGGKKFDCDDDGDGQPDVTEGPSCLGPGLGTDWDQDDLCEPNADPNPDFTQKPISRYP